LPVDILLKGKGEAVNISVPSEIVEILSKKKTVYLLNLFKEAKDKKVKTRYYR